MHALRIKWDNTQLLRIEITIQKRKEKKIMLARVKEIIEEQLNLEIDKKKLQLADPIKNFGTYHVPVRLHPKVTAEITVKVEQA